MLKREKEYRRKIIDWTKKNGKGECAGETIQFQVADGYAEYAVLSLNPVQLIHIDTADEYQFPYIHRLTAADIKEKIEQRRALEKIFGTKEED